MPRARECASSFHLSRPDHILLSSLLLQCSKWLGGNAEIVVLAHYHLYLDAIRKRFISSARAAEQSRLLSVGMCFGVIWAELESTEMDMCYGIIAWNRRILLWPLCRLREKEREPTIAWLGKWICPFDSVHVETFENPFRAIGLNEMWCWPLALPAQHQELVRRCFGTN